MEILAPSGTKASFLSAISGGCDAIYLGLTDFSARKNAENFSIDNLDYFTSYAHLFGVKVYVCVNTLIHDSELENFFELIKKADSFGVDAFIVQDIFLGKIIKNKIPTATLHLSTQSGINNLSGAILAKENGFERVVLARETDFKDIKAISQIIETEVFVQGALCTCLSGHCYFSAFIGGKSGNRGLCGQPCRQKYTYIDKNFQESGYLLSLSDLCLKDKILELKNLGVTSLKIEGRMRSPEYVYSATQVYKNLVSEKGFDKKAFSHLRRSFNRGNYTEGYTFKEDKNLIYSDNQSHIGEFVGKITSVKNGTATIKGVSFSKGDGFKIFSDQGVLGGVCMADGDRIETTQQAKVGDFVNITKDVSFNEYVMQLNKLYPIKVKAEIYSGKKAKLEADGIIVYSDEIVQKASTQPLNYEELLNNLKRTDIYPFEPSLAEFLTDNEAFMPKSALNKLRKQLFESVFYSKMPKHQKEKTFEAIEESNSIIFENKAIKNEIAVITSSTTLKISEQVTRVIFAPNDYQAENCVKFINSINSKSKKYLYLPAFLPDEYRQIVIDCIKTGFDGIYAEGLYAVKLARELNVEFFGGVELNLFNKLDENEIKKITPIYSISKELSEREFKDLDGFVLSLGGVKIMSLIYCPFKRECSSCNHSDNFMLKDYGNRIFPVRRYKLGKCRFEIYNERIICSDKVYNKMLFDLSNFNTNDAQNLLDMYFDGGFSKIKGNYSANLGRLVKGVE